MYTTGLIDKLINANYKYTTATDHASIIIEIGTEAEEYGKGTFRAPPYIHNDKRYHKKASEVIIDTILDNKVSNEESNFLKACLMTKRMTEENYYKLLNKEEQTENYPAILHEAKEQYALALSLELTVEEISYLPSEVQKGTELEVVLMKIKVFTLEHIKNKIKIRKETLNEVNTKLSIAENDGNLMSAKIYKEKYKILRMSASKRCGKKTQTNYTPRG